MSHEPASAIPLLLDIDPERSEPLYRQIYTGLREAILTGRVEPGTRIPSTRTLAQEMGLARNTVTQAFQQLVAEGFLESRVGSGTRVTEGVGADLLGERSEVREDRTSPRGPRRMSERGARIGRILTPTPASLSTRYTPAFQPGLPALDRFPMKTWARLAGRRWRKARPSDLNYSDGRGHPRLREAIAGYVGAARGVNCKPDQVLVVSGSQAALDLVARVLTDPGDAAWVEEPGYPGARSALAAAGARLVPVPVDEEGLDVAAGRRLAREARVVCVSPSHQFPLGVTMTLARRLELLRWSVRAGAWVVEDDYDSEYRYAGRPLMALQGLDQDRRVIYIGTFSKTLFPSLRLGYIVLPPDLVDTFLAARSLVDQQTPTVNELVLADFIDEGHFARHVRRMCSIYEERRDALIDAVDSELAGGLDLVPADTGLHLVGWLPDRCEDIAVFRAAGERGVRVLPLSILYDRPPERAGLALGYGAVPPESSPEAVRRLARAVEAVARGR